eukprot:gene3224-5539_t
MNEEVDEPKVSFKYISTMLEKISPSLDKTRTYGLQEKKIGSIYVDFLGLKNTSTAKRILEWKNPNYSKKSDLTNFSDTIHSILTERGWKENRKLTVHELNEYLDDLCMKETMNEKKQLLKEIFKATTAIEQKWLIRIILKDMKINFTSIMKAFHPAAEKLYNECTDLKEVCMKCQDPKFIYNEKNLKIFSSVKPMLATHYLKFQTISSKNMIMEKKFDGERIMVHKDKGKYMYITRNGTNFTEHYDCLNSMLSKQIKGENYIIDGEMMVWNEKFGRFKEFGNQRTLEQNEDFCYQIFDVLFLNGKDLTNCTLFERRKTLQKIVIQTEHKLELTEQTKIASEQQILLVFSISHISSDRLEEAILNRDEGIMIKDLDSEYIPGERSKNWLKFKPDHQISVGDTLDLMIIGGYYGTKFQKKSISHFLLGYKKEDSFIPFCKVGSGYTNSELTILQSKLESHWRKYRQSYFPQWIPGSSEIPDFYIDPKNSVVLEIKAFSIIPSTSFKANYTLRFPRVVQIRTDKNLEDCLDEPGFQELLELQKNSSSIAGHKKKIQFIPTETKEEIKLSSLFLNIEFCLFSQNSKIEESILQHEGNIVKNPTQKTKFIISNQNIKIQNWIKQCKSKKNPYDYLDVLKYEWIQDCIRKKRIVDLHPKYMIYTSKKTQKLFDELMDEFEDHFFEDASIDSLKKSLKKVEELKKEEKSISLIKQFKKENLVSEGWISHLCIYFDRYKYVGKQDFPLSNNALHFLEQKFRYLGGDVSKEATENVTHIVVDGNTNLRTLFFSYFG